MDERLRFVARLLDGEKMAGLCRSRRTVCGLFGPLQSLRQADERVTRDDSKCVPGRI